MAMTDRDKKVLAAVIALIVIGGFWFLLLKPKQAAISAANQRKQEAQTALDSATAAEAAAKSIKVAKPLSYAKLVRLGTAVPADSDFESVLVQINDAANSAGVEMNNLSVAANVDAGATGVAGSSTCEAEPGASGATGAAPAAAPAAAGATGSTSQTWVGQSRDKAQDAAADTNAASNASASASADAPELSCDAAPTLADLSAQAAGLNRYSYTLTFRGSFFDLNRLLSKLMDMVKTQNGRVNVTGRLFDIKQMSYALDEFPALTASVQLTGYSMPVGGAPAAATPAPATGTPAATTTPAG